MAGLVENVGVKTKLAPTMPPPDRWQGVRTSLRPFVSSPVMLLAVLVILVNVVVAIAAPWIMPYDPLEPNYNAPLRPPSLAHPFGTDSAGRDVLSRVILGGRVSLSVGLIAVSIGMFIGLLIGLPSGYFGGWVDSVVMRLVDIMLVFPAFLLALTLSAALGSSITNVMLAIGLAAAPNYARLVRGSTLTVRNLDYVTAATTVGASHLRIMLRHVTPNIIAPVVVYGTLQISTAILSEASLSFLGFGVNPPTPSWGSVVAEGRTQLIWAPWISTIPGVIISTMVIALNLMGDTFRDAIDPQVRKIADHR